ncbi:hypothetical protein C343_05017 [Cryptococcus neoformans C23]|uniref:Uncharacterized protein n=2 Tax=Cryptococcus neoformans TaxID=5207 RepID=A0A854QBZ1_CRYNE|nr:hypothetical protein CNAG_04160 [Cryptococcus neoformans var. grubii H99]AUB26854.1 hypothetical protein CKF44_04160 [Cryptococcus neoformans var. grubii]OWZ29196.1 hypothetical protein C347_05063 [Cryptococcus neoformans var. grubii AD2-60a]OWZ41062.1 hypothetical protein C343_05017 [Cryptococcus neoformans var. grubii C23]OWZ52132.1 hypothetical protein C368_05173 [Cryptococcus neoformans var. grubii 125.91]OXC83044.1 hypothetical protein C344_04745 [Cryptococcus neoformans var. grubii AD|eukprot:XP_012051425.1 hypothetical protein CNAG_04160 [Cryptococcus neoformans var. grubii H99]
MSGAVLSLVVSWVSSLLTINKPVRDGSSDVGGDYRYSSLIFIPKTAGDLAEQLPSRDKFERLDIARLYRDASLNHLAHSSYHPPHVLRLEETRLLDTIPVLLLVHLCSKHDRFDCILP